MEPGSIRLAVEWGGTTVEVSCPVDPCCDVTEVAGMLDFHVAMVRGALFAPFPSVREGSVGSFPAPEYVN